MADDSDAPLPDAQLVTRSGKAVSAVTTRAQRRAAAIAAPLVLGVARRDTALVERPGWWQTITPSTRSAQLNEIALSKLRAGEVDDAIDAAVATYHSRGLPVKWCVGPWTEPGDFGARLTERGFEHWDVRGMACSTSLAPDLPTPVEVAQVDEGNLDQYLAAAMAGWSVPPDQLPLERVAMLDALHAAPRIAHFWVASVDDRPVATTGVIVRGDYGYLTGTQVLEHARGRGIYRALIRTRLEFLRESGIPLAVTQAREATSAPILAHLGFETVFRSRCYLLAAPPAPVP